MSSRRSLAWLSTRQQVLATLVALLCTFSTVNVYAQLVAAVLPSSRSVLVGEYSSFFATVINTGAQPAQNCGASVRNSVGGTFWYRPSLSTNNFPIGERSTAVDIPAGAAQTFFLEYRNSSILAPIELEFDFVCDGVAPAPVTAGVNTLLFSANAVRTPDVIALTATPSADGIVNLPVDGSRGFFTAATSNVGASGQIFVSVLGRGDITPSEAVVCATDRFTGQCESDLAPTIGLQMNSRSVNTFSVFLRADSTIDFDPANNRVVLQFTDAAGEIRGATSVAVRSADLTIGGLPASSVVAGESYEFIPTIGRRSGRDVEILIANRPPWLDIAAGGRLVGQPSNSDVGIYSNIRLSVSDGINEATLPPFSIEVIASPWRFAAALPYNTAQHSMATVDGRLFNFGGSATGISNTSVREYVGAQNTWVSRAPMPGGVLLGNGHGVAGKAYVFGGLGRVNNTASHTVQIYDPELNSWTQDDMPFDRYGVASAEVDGFIYFFGGLTPASNSLSNATNVYNTTTGTWVEGPLVPVRCDGSAAAAIGPLIYLTGGCNNTNNRQVHVFDTDTGSWSETTSLPVSIGYHGSVALNDKLYVVGGFEFQSDGSGQRKQDVYVFDPATAQWTNARSMRTERSAFGTAVFEDEIWVSGGFNTDLVEAYTPSLDNALESPSL